MIGFYFRWQTITEKGYAGFSKMSNKVLIWALIWTSKKKPSHLCDWTWNIHERNFAGNEMNWLNKINSQSMTDYCCFIGLRDWWTIIILYTNKHREAHTSPNATFLVVAVNVCMSVFAYVWKFVSNVICKQKQIERETLHFNLHICLDNETHCAINSIFCCVWATERERERGRERKTSARHWDRL